MLLTIVIFIEQCFISIVKKRYMQFKYTALCITQSICFSQLLQWKFSLLVSVVLLVDMSTCQVANICAVIVYFVSFVCDNCVAYLFTVHLNSLSLILASSIPGPHAPAWAVVSHGLVTWSILFESCDLLWSGLRFQNNGKNTSEILLISEIRERKTKVTVMGDSMSVPLLSVSFSFIYFLMDVPFDHRYSFIIMMFSQWQWLFFVALYPLWHIYQLNYSIIIQINDCSFGYWLC